MLDYVHLLDVFRALLISYDDVVSYDDISMVI